MFRYLVERAGARQTAQTVYHAYLLCYLQQRGSNFAGDGHLTHHCEYRLQQPSAGSGSPGEIPEHIISIREEGMMYLGEVLNYQSWDLT